MIVYHGSSSKFEIFNFSKIGLNGTSEGKGIYFTDNKSIASGYAQNGFLYTVKLHMNKPLTLNENKISKAELRKVFQYLYNLDEYHLSNYGEVDFEGLEKVLNYAVENTYNGRCDVDMLGGLITAIGDAEIVNNAVYEVLGYDSIIAVPKWRTDEQTLYIALINDIIEIKEVTEIK